MKPLLILAVIAASAVGGVTVAGAQTSASIASVPANGSTGPTFPGVRSIDQNATTTPSGKAAAPSNIASTSLDNERSSGGLNAEPDNHGGAPGPGSGVTTR